MSAEVGYSVTRQPDGSAIVICSAHGEIRRIPAGRPVGSAIAAHVNLDTTILRELGEVAR